MMSAKNSRRGRPAQHCREPIPPRGGALSLGSWNAGSSAFGDDPGKSPGGCQEQRSLHSPLLRHLHEIREFEFPFRDCLRPDCNLLTVLPLEDEAGHGARAGLDAVGKFVVLAVELDVPDGAFEIGLLKLGYHL